MDIILFLSMTLILLFLHACIKWHRKHKRVSFITKQLEKIKKL